MECMYNIQNIWDLQNKNQNKLFNWQILRMVTKIIQRYKVPTHIFFYFYNAYNLINEVKGKQKCKAASGIQMHDTIIKFKYSNIIEIC